MKKSLLRSSQREKSRSSSLKSSASSGSGRRISYVQCPAGSSPRGGRNVSTDASSIKARFLAGSTVKINEIERKASCRIPLKDMRLLIRERADEIIRAASH